MEVRTERADSSAAAHAGDSDAGTVSLTPRVRAEIVQILLRQVPGALGASLICAALVTYVVWDSVPHGPLLAWSVAMAAATVGRLWLWVRLRARRPGFENHTSANHTGFLISAAIGGTLWGAGAALVILTSNSVSDVVFVGFVSAGIAAGAMAGLGGHLPIFYASVMPNLVLCAGAFFARLESPYPIMGAMALVFAGALAYFSRNIHRAMARSAHLRFENLDLVERLGRAREAADALVVERTQALSQANRDLERRMRESGRAESAQRQTAAQLRLIADNLPVYISLIGADLRFRFTNALYRESYGIPLEGMVGLHVSDVVGPEVFDEIRPYLAQAFAGEPVKYEGVRHLRNGQRIFRVMLVPHRGDDGSIDSVVSLAVDLTEERLREQALRESEERLRRVIQNMPVMMYALDADGILIAWNRECERVTGFDAERIVGKPQGFELLFPDPSYRAEIRRTIFAHADFRDWEARVACADGSVRTVSWFNISGTFPVPGWASWGMGVDVSDRAKARESLEEALVRERELSELKSSFVAMASHEFRTPLTSIQASVDLLRRYGDRMSEEQKFENLRGISREITTVTDLLEDILTLGRADAGRLEFRPRSIDLRSLCIDQLEKIKLTARPNQSFVFDCVGNCASVFVDEQLVLHILTNMLSNAVKYSPTGGQITLTLRCANTDIVLSVGDRGIGVPKGGREHLFDAFHRFGNVGTISGTGLGLAIMKRAAERHGGTVSLESEEGAGTTVTAHLPIIEPADRR